MFQDFKLILVLKAKIQHTHAYISLLYRRHVWCFKLFDFGEYCSPFFLSRCRKCEVVLYCLNVSHDIFAEESRTKKSKLFVKYVSLPIKISYIDFDFNLFYGIPCGICMRQKTGFHQERKIFRLWFLVSFHPWACVCVCGFIELSGFLGSSLPLDSKIFHISEENNIYGFTLK